MATYIFAVCDEDRAYGDYLYAKTSVGGMSPWQSTVKDLGAWSLGSSYSRPAGDSVPVSRYSVERSSAYTVDFSFALSLAKDEATYDYCGSLIGNLTSSTTMEVPYTNLSNQFTLTTSTSTEWCIVPVYIARACTLTCNGNGGIPATQTVSFRSGNTVTLPDAPILEGYTFAGWKIGDSIYEAGEEVRLVADSTAVAQWNATPTPPHGSGSGLLGATQGGSLAFNPNSSSLVYN